MITVKKPIECSEAELQDFAAFVQAGGEVTPVGLEDRIKKAEKLIFLVQDDCLKGIAAIKNPERNYKENIFRKAQATIEAKLFPFELGWVFVLPSSRGAKFSHKLVEAALSATNGQAVFATSRTDNAPMHKALKKNGFSCHGNTYGSDRGQQQLTLFVRSADQQDPLQVKRQ
jgi:predicted GNAT family N-acyltransferase